MRLAEWEHALAELNALYRIHGHQVPIPEAMAALNATSRATFYRRLDDLRAAGWTAQPAGAALILIAPSPAKPQPAARSRRSHGGL